METRVNRRTVGTLPRALVTCTAAAAALTACVVLLRHAARYFFLFDDFIILHEASTSSVTRLATTPAFRFYRPLGYLLAKLEFGVFGWQYPYAYAAASSLWHCGNALLVGGIARRLGATRAGAFVAAVLFLLSPWSSETYFWMSAGFDLLSASAVLGSVLGALLMDAATSTRRRAGWFALGCTCALIAPFAKENGVVLPALLLVLIGVSRPRALRGAWFPPYFLASLGAVGSYLWIRETALPGLGGSYGAALALYAQSDLLRNITSYPRAFITFPSYNVGLGHWPPPVVVALLGLGYVGIGVSAASSGWRLTTAGTLSFLISLAPVVWLAMPPGSSAGGRLLYLPAAWVSVLMGFGADGESTRRSSAPGLSSWRARAGQLGVVAVLAVAVPSVLYQFRLWRIATDISRSAIRQFEPILDRGIASVYIPNLPFWFAEGPYALKSDSFACYYGDKHQVPVVTAREMVVTAHNGELQFAGWVEDSLRSTTSAPSGRVLELQLGMSGAWSSLVTPSRISVFARSGSASVTSGRVSLSAPPDASWQVEPPATAHYRLAPAAGVGPTVLTVTPQTCTEPVSVEATSAIRLAGTDVPISLVVRYRCVAGSGRPPFGFIDVPSGPVVPDDESILFQGWVLDDLDIRRVWLEAVDAQRRRTPLGEASRLGFRPDVAAHFPDAFDIYNDGWSLLVPAHALQSLSRPGFVIVLAEDGDGNRTELGRRPVR
jgi:hypothetical protein